MIVFDENMQQRSIMDAVAAWYRGRVISVTVLRPGTRIKDEAIPLYCTVHSVPAHARYGIVCLVLPAERLPETSSLLRQLFSLPEFKTKARRMGKVVRMSRVQLEYYDIRAHHIIRVLSWLV